MRKYMMLLGKESFWLLGVAAIAFCVGIIISVDWLTNICWSIVAATIVYGVTVVLSRYSERKYRSIFLRKYVSALLEVGVNLFQNITSKNSSVIPLDVDIEKACQTLDLSISPSLAYHFHGDDFNWMRYLDDCRSQIESNVHEIIMIAQLDYPEFGVVVDNLYDNFKTVHRYFYLAYYMEDGSKKASTVPFLASNVKNLASSFLKVKEYVEVF